MKKNLKFKQGAYIYMIVFILKTFFDYLKPKIFQGNYTEISPWLNLVLIVLIAQIGIHFLPGAIFTKIKKMSFKKVYRLNTFNKKQFFLSISLFVISQVVILFIHNLMNFISAMLSKEYGMSTYPVAEDFTTLFLLFLLIGVIPPLCEELLCRGFLLTTSEEYGYKFAIIYSGFCFALLHANVYRFVELFYFGIILAIIVYYTNSIWTGIIMHIINNSVYVISSYFIGGDMVMNSSINTKIVTINQNVLFRFIGLALLAGIAFMISMYLIKRLRLIWIEQGEPCNDDKCSINFELKKLINIPMIIIIVLFFIRVVIKCQS